jgi:hypothetical protein
MRAVSDRWRVFQTALGSRRYALADLFKLVLAVAAALYFYWYGRTMTAFEWTASGVVVILAFFFWVTLEYALLLTRKISDGRVRIAELRNKGVEIRNRGRRTVHDRPSWEAWKTEVLSWNDDVIRELREISVADALWFSVLDVVPTPRLHPEQVPGGEDKTAFLKLFGEHDARLARLGEMIRQLWKST